MEKFNLLTKTIKFCLMFALILLASCKKQQRSVENHDMDFAEQEFAPPSVEEILEWRENIRYERYVDSVFLHMPTPILTQILVSKGTSISNSEIVNTYITNKKVYDDIILKSMQIQKKYIPDSIPKSSLPQANSDTIHSAVLE